MKRLFFYAGFALTAAFFSSCAQHDAKSPDTSGGVPYNQPGVGVDTTNAEATNNTSTPNNNNDGSNNNQAVNTGDSNSRKQ
jgi:hypothetical protein